MPHTDKYSQHSSITCPVWINGWVFIYKLGGGEFESCYYHLNFRYRTCFEQFLEQLKSVDLLWNAYVTW